MKMIKKSWQSAVRSSQLAVTAGLAFMHAFFIRISRQVSSKKPSTACTERSRSVYRLPLAVIGTLLIACQPPIPKEIAQAYEELPEKVDFNFHIKPILADRCYKCHGPDDNAREAEFRLDLEDEAFAKLEKSGGRAFVKGNTGKSVAWQRITSDDSEFHMPPPESNLSLSAKEKALITKWIKQGAEWKEHWAFISTEKPEIPEVEGNTINLIDNFVLQKVYENGLTPSEEAGKERLIRRVTMDLTGLPPTIDETDQFLSDDSPRAYEELVDRLLTTDAHAERMALEWLDIARYGDTQGMHFDGERYIWPWRDWVIRAFKRNLPYDDFITWQIAGDLLPNASRDQKLATAFHRNHPATSEGGVPDEEFRQKYVMDRTNTTATAFLGLTLECATCHDHKFDPISQKEYYQMSSFFNNLREIGMVSELRNVSPETGGYVLASGPVLLLPEQETEQQLTELSKKIEQNRKQQELTKNQVVAVKDFMEAVANKAIKPPNPDAEYAFESLRLHKEKVGVVHRIQNNSPIDKMVDNDPKAVACGNLEIVPGRIGNALRSANEVDMVFLKDVGYFELNEPYSAGAWIHTEKEGENQTIMGTQWIVGGGWRGWDFYLDSLRRPTIKVVSIWPHNYIQITAENAVPKEEWKHVFFTYDGSAKASGLQLYINGKKVKSFTNYDNLYRSIIHKSWVKMEGWRERPVIVFRSGRYHTGENGVFKGSIDQVKIFRQYLSPLEVAALFERETNSELNKEIFDQDDYVLHYLNRNHTDFQSLTKELRQLLAKKLALMSTVPEITVMADMPTPRKTFVLNRGQYNQPTEEVEAGTPQKIMSFPEDLPKNRLGLAQWLVDERNPLTARVTVNRYWQMIFGNGIVDTPHDFGTQGALPTHPELLDWLALYLIDSGWDVRDLLKKMVMSATYRQSSMVSSEHKEKDAKNLFLARSPSYRLQAEMIRDNALAASGLLTKKVGGPSVKPYQPEDVWDFGVLISGKYEEDSGEDLYRRSMYTYIRRTTPHPAMVAFDAPNRLVCIAKRENTNTPLQALVLLNDPQFVEASRVLAQRMQKEVGDGYEEQITHGFRLLCGRKPGSKEMKIMKDQYRFAMESYEKDPSKAADIINVGEFPYDESLDKTETAALAVVANTMMNFDEAYMKR